MPEKTLPHKTIIKKRTARFDRNQSDRFKRVGPSWRKPHGIDSSMRKQYSGQRPMVSIGYGSDKETRYMLPNGLLKVTVSNANQVRALLTNNQTHACEIAHGVSAKKRVEIIRACRELNVKVTNAHARMHKAEN